MEAWVRYVLETFKQVYGLSQDPPIYYGENEKRQGVVVKNHAGLFFRKDRSIEPSQVQWRQWRNISVPFLFGDSFSDGILDTSGDNVTVTHDIIASSFYLLSGWHEFQLRKKKTFDRYRYDDSLICELGVPYLPVVNYYFDILMEGLDTYKGKKYQVSQSKKGRYSIALTHDIDSLHSGWMEDGWSAIKARKFTSAFQIGWNRFRGYDTRFNLREMAQIEKEWEVKASYYFLARKGTYYNLKHADYSLDNDIVRSEIQFLNEEGHEIGIHGSKGGHQNGRLFNEEIDSLGVPIHGVRFHYLNFDLSQTPRILEDSGLEYDSTLGFGEHIGFRNGIAHPFYLFDLTQMESTNVLELPLVIMDATLRNKEYMGLEPKEAYKKCLKIFESLKTFNGAVAILWHNSYFTKYKFAGWRKLLDKIVKDCKQHGGYIGTAYEIISDFQR